MEKTFNESENIFGIPVTNGKLLSKTDKGFIVSFNMEHLLMKCLLKGQIYTKNKQPLTPIVSPNLLPNIFQYPLLPNSPDFALAQKESKIFLFIKTPKFQLSQDLRAVFWFQRHVIPVKNDNDFLDIPDEDIPLLKALVHKDLLLAQDKPIPHELEEEINKMSEQLEKNGNRQNYYVVDTFNLSNADLEKLSSDNMQSKESNCKKGNNKEGITKKDNLPLRTGNTEVQTESSDSQILSNEIKNYQAIVIRQKNKIKTLEKGISKSDLEKMIDRNCRKKNGKINYSELGRRLGCTNKTAKNKCDYYNLS